MNQTILNSRGWAGRAAVLAVLVPSALWAAVPSANPIAVCTDSTSASQQSRTYYRFKFSESSTSGSLVRLDLPDGTQAGAAASVPTPVETSVLTTPYQTAGMGTAADGSIYAMEACGSTPRAGCNNLNLLRYDASGATVVGQVSGLPGIAGPGTQMGAAVNAADIHLPSGDLIVGVLRTGGSMSTLYRINVNTLVATPITLGSAIPGSTSGDFAIDPTGQFAYGVSFSASAPLNSYSYRVNLVTGTVATLQTIAGPTFPVGGAAWLANGKLALTSNSNALLGVPTAGITYIGDPATGAMLTNDYASNGTTQSDSTDGSSCMPLTRVTKKVVDSVGGASTAAPAGAYAFSVTCVGGAPAFDAVSGLTGSITNVNSVVQAEGYADVLLPVGSTGCTVTEVTASLPAAPAGYTWGTTPTYVQPATPLALVGPIVATITNVLTAPATGGGSDVKAVPATDAWALLLLGLGLAWAAWRARRQAG